MAGKPQNKKTVDKRKDNLPKKAGPGRPKGSKNKLPLQVKECILQALDKLGGVKYLVDVGKKNPKAFCSLLGRVLPTEITGEGGGPIEMLNRVEVFKLPDNERGTD